jgi:CheY-like chemotaxis protein
MTTIMNRPSGASGEQATASARSELDVLAQQLAAIERFNRNLKTARGAAAAASSRETRMDMDRRMDVLRRQQEAVIARAHEQLHGTGELLPSTARRRVVLAHRNEWYLDRVSAVLRDHGAHVVARLDNGADAIGVALCEQPDVVLVEDTLAMVPGEQVVRELRALCPSTRIVAQCAYGDRVGALLEAGAAAAFARKVPPADVAEAMHRLMALPDLT